MRNVSHSTTDMISKISQDIMKFCFPCPILKDKYVSHSSKYNGSCKSCVKLIPNLNFLTFVSLHSTPLKYVCNSYLQKRLKQDVHT